MQYRRAKTPGSSYFFTVVTHNRHPILCEPENIDTTWKVSLKSLQLKDSGDRT